jgi:hypothetical protein
MSRTQKCRMNDSSFAFESRRIYHIMPIAFAFSRCTLSKQTCELLKSDMQEDANEPQTESHTTKVVCLFVSALGNKENRLRRFSTELQSEMPSGYTIVQSHVPRHFDSRCSAFGWRRRGGWRRSLVVTELGSTRWRQLRKAKWKSYLRRTRTTTTTTTTMMIMMRTELR